MALAGFVETPILGDAQGPVAGRLVLDVHMAGGARGNFQRAVRGPALLSDDAGVAPGAGLGGGVGIAEVLGPVAKTVHFVGVPGRE